MRWTEQFKPDDWSQIVGNEESREQFIHWLDKWSPEHGKKAGLLYGPPGTGKTITVEIAAKRLGYNLIELNASDVRTKDVLMNEIYPASRSFSLYGKRNLILLDEIDGLHQRQDTGGAAAVLKLIEGTNSPVVLTANDPWKPSLREIRLKSQTFELKRLRKDSVTKRLRAIAKSQSLTVSDSALDRIAEKSHGDMRSAISDLEALASRGSVLEEETVSQILQDRIHEENIFEAIRGAMHSRSVQEARNHLSGTGLMVDDLVDWVYGNLENLDGDIDTLNVVARAVADSDYLSALMRKERT
ncbi:MAG TPA: AAA family ATPase, partial [Thermoproteota archaeon]|nr:AAA family ATPase [Thermoproteota archaeon]